jgi:hypothetical protein
MQRLGDRCLPIGAPRAGTAAEDWPALAPVAPTPETIAPASIARALDKVAGRLPWFARRASVVEAAQLGAATQGSIAAWDLGRCETLSTAVAVAGARQPLEVLYLFKGDNLVGWAVRFSVIDEATRALYDGVIRQIEERLGRGVGIPPGGPHVRYARGAMVVDAELNPSAALTSQLGRPAFAARITFGVPRVMLDEAAGRARGKAGSR